MSGRYRADLPPFTIGQRIRWNGGYSVATGDGRHLYGPGDVAEVIENRRGLDAHPEFFGPDDRPVHGWSILQFASGARIAISRENTAGLELLREGTA